MTHSGTSKMQSPELIELIAAARAFLPSDDVAFVYHDADVGESYRTCCHAVYRYYPYNRVVNSHANDCAAVRLAAALAVFEAAT